MGKQDYVSTSASKAASVEGKISHQVAAKKTATKNAAVRPPMSHPKDTYNIYQYYSQSQGLDIELPPIRHPSGKTRISKPLNQKRPFVLPTKSIIERIAMQQDCVDELELEEMKENVTVDEEGPSKALTT